MSSSIEILKIEIYERQRDRAKFSKIYLIMIETEIVSKNEKEKNDTFFNKYYFA